MVLAVLLYLYPEVISKERAMTSGTVLGAATSTAATAAVLSLPNTGSNGYLTIALSVGVGLLTWGVLYARAR
jgi:hypothetical protein